MWNHMKNSLYDHCPKQIYTTMYHSPFKRGNTKLFLIGHSTLSFNPSTIPHLQSFCRESMYLLQLLEHLLVLTVLAVL